ncbi:hypothetical protein N0V90_003659 [Kalmusia sp. IMI 367209]|nr:hypothetical protein N0V90_003659 [Kalmusia sp. IMI 367209]
MPGLVSAAGTLSLPANLPAGWSFAGCYSDVAFGEFPRALGGQPTGDNGVAMNNRYNPNGAAKCISKCLTLDPAYTYVGTADNQCWCDFSINPNNTVNAGLGSFNDDDCAQPCRGNTAETCGNTDGATKISIYKNAPARKQMVHIYGALEPYGRYAIGGRLKSIGISGLSLIGSFHYFSNKYGFAMDNLVNYNVVLGNGSQVIANLHFTPRFILGLERRRQ